MVRPRITKLQACVMLTKKTQPLNRALLKVVFFTFLDPGAGGSGGPREAPPEPSVGLPKASGGLPKASST